MSRFWSPLVHTLAPYTAGEQPQGSSRVIKLNTNELPWGPSPWVTAAVEREAAALRLYPDPQSGELRGALAGYHGVAPEQVFTGNGSDDVLAHAFAALLKQGRPTLFPDVTYGFYPAYCRLFAIDHRTVPLDDDFGLPLGRFGPDAGAIIFPNPNAPTGRALSRAQIAQLLDRHRDIPVVIDEAYVDFGAESAVPLIGAYPNLLVVQTMSKSRGLAGLRVGYALGDAALIEALVRVKDSFNSYPVDRLAQKAAVASLRDEPHFRESCARIGRNRDALVAGLTAQGFEVVPSLANFVLCRHQQRPAVQIAAGLRAQDILVRHFDTPRVRDFLRITVGTEDEIERLLAALRGLT